MDGDGSVGWAPCENSGRDRRKEIYGARQGAIKGSLGTGVGSEYRGEQGGEECMYVWLLAVEDKGWQKGGAWEYGVGRGAKSSVTESNVHGG